MDFSEFKTLYNLKLDPQQEQAVQTVDGPVMLLAVPGSGKTTVLVTRIGYMLFVRGISPEKILTMTYTIAAARDMKERFSTFFGDSAENHLEFRTINGVCSRIIRLYERMFNRRAFDLLDDSRQQRAILAELCRQQSSEYISESTLNAIETAITYVKNQMLKGDELNTVEVEGIDFPQLYRAYCNVLRDRQLMDYDDQMVYALKILRQYPPVLQKIQEQYEYFCVDEAQDSSKIQHTIIQLLSSRTRNLFMVGDEDQSIYGFRAAYPQALTQFEAFYPGAKVLYMEQNYRSAKEIVAMADKFIQHNKNRHPKHMKATRPSGAAPKEITVFDRHNQYRYLCKLASDCNRETAVLYRDNDSALPLIDMLERQGIPYRCRQLNTAFFTNRVVRDVSDIIHLALEPYNRECFMNVYYKMGAGINRRMAEEASVNAVREGDNIFSYISEMPNASAWTKKQCRSLETHMRNLCLESADKAVYRIVNYMGYGEYLERSGLDSSRIAILEALGASEPTPLRLLERLDELKEIVEKGSPAGPDCPFILSTIHSSKGLEYDRVILMDVTDGVFPAVIPGSDATDDEKDAYEEERRLFYVAMTRAKNELNVFTFTKSGMSSVFSREIFKGVKLKTAVKKKLSGLKAADAPDIDTSGYVAGAEIVHKTFGTGKISELSGDRVTIIFKDGSLKRFSLSVALKAGQIKLN